MKDKKWKDCPCCGKKNSMFFKKNHYSEYQSKNYPKIRIGPLSGHFCKECHDGFLTRRSERIVDSKLVEHMARIDSEHTVASAIMPVSDVVKLFKKSRQWVHKLMKSGALAYVFIGNQRYPKREAVLKYQTLQSLG